MIVCKRCNSEINCEDSMTVILTDNIKQECIIRYRICHNCLKKYHNMNIIKEYKIVKDNKTLEIFDTFDIEGI